MNAPGITRSKPKPIHRRRVSSISGDHELLQSAVRIVPESIADTTSESADLELSAEDWMPSASLNELRVLFETIDTPSAGLLCGLHALRINMNWQLPAIPGFPSPGSSALKYVTSRRHW